MEIWLINYDKCISCIITPSYYISTFWALIGNVSFSSSDAISQCNSNLQFTGELRESTACCSTRAGMYTWFTASWVDDFLTYNSIVACSVLQWKGVSGRSLYHGNRLTSSFYILNQITVYMKMWLVYDVINENVNRLGFCERLWQGSSEWSWPIRFDCHTVDLWTLLDTGNRSAPTGPRPRSSCTDHHSDRGQGSGRGSSCSHTSDL